MSKQKNVIILTAFKFFSLNPVTKNKTLSHMAIIGDVSRHNCCPRTLKKSIDGRISYAPNTSAILCEVKNSIVSRIRRKIYDSLMYYSNRFDSFSTYLQSGWNKFSYSQYRANSMIHVGNWCKCMHHFNFCIVFWSFGAHYKICGRPLRVTVFIER